MTADPRYDILFEPVQIGPVTAPNRFYQVPHCNGMGFQYPSSMAEMRAIKAEGGWGVVNTEECEIHYSSELSGVIESRLWDDSDIPVLAKMVEGIHRNGSLAGIEPAHLGAGASNLYSREIPMGPSARPVDLIDPIQARAMDKADIRAFRKMHVDAALRAKKAGFDIIYVYAGHDMTTLMHFLSRSRNARTDEYGGSLENRVRLLREVLIDTKEAVGDSCAVAIRLAVDELQGEDGISASGEGRDIVEMLAELPDLWDVNVSGWENDSATSRFSEEGFQNAYISFVKDVTTKPVVGVGRFTSPDTMVSMIKKGVMDLIGAARPSIADPFLPTKIKEGRFEDIRECIGCNICVTADFQSVPLRCTQNPTMGEEWRKRWHPERVPTKTGTERFLIIGAGPAGLEAAHILGKRGYQVTLADQRAEAGGRVAIEARLPGLSAWKRVADYRLQQIEKLPNVALYLESEMTPSSIAEFGADQVVLATGSSWTTSGVGRTNGLGIEIEDGAAIASVDALCRNAPVKGPVLIFDDDYYYMGGLLAEKLRLEGLDVTYVTPEADVSHYTHFTMEQERIQRRLLELGVEILTHKNLLSVRPGEVTLACTFTDREETRAAATLVPVTMREPVDGLFHALAAGMDRERLHRIGDCFAPGTIASAVYQGHRFAREFGAPKTEEVPFRRELVALAQD